MTVFHYKGLDEVIHGRVRLAIMAFLSTAEQADFNELKEGLDVTDGNLSVQLRKLEEAGYVAVRKGYRGRRPHTDVTITDAGRAALRAYHTQLREMLGRLDRAEDGA